MLFIKIFTKLNTKFAFWHNHFCLSSVMEFMRLFIIINGII